MADNFAGAQKIGFLLGGGAGQIKREAYNQGRLNTAKTEEALANARKAQLEATAKAEAARTAAQVENDYIAMHPGDPDAAKKARLIGHLVVSGTGSDFYAALQGLGEGQEQDFRDILADPTASAEARLRAGEGVQGKVQGDIAPVGSHGTVDLTQDDQELIVPPGGGGDASTAMKNYLFRQSLTDPREIAEFDQMVRADRVFSAGGVPTVLPGVNPGGGGGRPAVDPATVASNASRVAEGKKLGTTVAAQKADFPQVRYARDQNKLSIQEQNKLIDELLSDEKLWQAVGPTRLVAEIPGTEGAYLRGKLDTLGNKQMLSTLINLRAMSKTGGAVGNVSDREGETMRGAQGAITNFNLMAGDMRRELMRVREYNTQFEKIMDDAFNATYDAQGNPILGGGTEQGGGGSEGLQPGARFIDEDSGVEYEYGGEPGGDGTNPDDWYPVAQ